MALELKNLSQQNQDGDEKWNKFCNTYIKRAEEKWTKKLEDYDSNNDEVHGDGTSSDSNE